MLNLVRSSSLILAIIAAGSSAAHAGLIIDQQSTSGGATAAGSTAAGQSFRPMLTAIEFVRFSLYSAGSTTAVVDLFSGQGYGGTLLGSTQAITFSNTMASGFTTYQFNFLTLRSLVPNNFYTFRIRALPATSTYSVEFNDVAAAPNPYTRGNSYNSAGAATPTGRDLVFSEGVFAAPEPSTLIGGSLAVMIGVGTQIRRRRRCLC